MAAEAILNMALKTLTSVIKEEIRLIIGADKEMDKLAKSFTAIKATLEDAELKQPESKQIRDWLIKLKDMLYEIDDILDECATHVSMVKDRNSVLGGYSLKEISFRHDIGRRIKQAVEKLHDIEKDHATLHLRERDFEGPSQTVAARETSSLLNEPDQIFGREDDKEEIVDILVNQVKKNHEISIQPIIGIGGLGKTTLAQLVFNDQRVDEHFDTKMWVCVSDNFDLKTLVKAMIESESGRSASDLDHLEALQRRLSGLLNGKRYFLVLDDVWNDDQEKWSQLRNAMCCGSPGSSIIVTTRLQKVAEIMGTLATFNLKELSEKQCWVLLKHRAFQCDEEEKYPHLEAIGKQIVKKCAGVPLAANALGGLLRFKRTEKEWIHVEESEIWELPKESKILPALRLSYQHLPLELRQCFSYCAIFPKDTSIEKEKLIFLWMAHGYISSNETMEAEEVGEQVWNELLLRSLFEKARFDGELATEVRMHDLVHDLAQSIMENKVPGMQIGSMSTSAPNIKIREVNLSEHFVAFPRSTQTGMDISLVLKRYNRLRVLDASYRKIQVLPCSISGLKHLRNLNLSGSDFRTLPDSLCNLWNLQVLNLDYCYELVGLPKKMRRLKNLRHLLLESCSSLHETPSRIRELTSLKTLGVFIVGFNKGNRLEELEFLDLGGKLEIRHLERVANLIDAKKANLAKKHNLHGLNLVWEVNKGSNSREDKDEKILESLRPFPNLENFCIYGYSGKHLPDLMKELENLVRIEVKNCQSLSGLCHLEVLPHLEYLKLENLAIEYIVQDGNAQNIYFPSLKELQLSFLDDLKGLYKEKPGSEMCPSLRKLVIFCCPSLVFSPPVSFNKLYDLDCDDSSILASFSKLDSLRSLVANIGDNMSRIPSGLLDQLSNVETLSINGAHEQCIPVNGLRGLNSLQTLEIMDSETLTCLPMEWGLQYNTTLEDIFITSCSEFVEMSEEIKHLHSLRGIYLTDLPKMVCIPQVIRHLSSLQHLDIEDLPQLTSMPYWLGDLTSLLSLRIRECPKLASLPSSIQRLTNLKYLDIIDCPHLERRCRKEEGEDWHKVAHIPYLEFE